jgi:hypothetical protein
MKALALALLVLSAQAMEYSVKMIGSKVGPRIFFELTQRIAIFC